MPGYTMTVVNPAGKPLSSSERDGLVTYRPRLASGRRVTLKIPHDVAAELQEEPDLQRRHQRALDAALKGPTPRARAEHVDVATGTRTRKPDPGTRPTGQLIAEIEGTTVEVDREDLVGKPGRRGQRFDLGSPMGYLDRARQKPTNKATPSLKCPPRIRGLATTYPSAKAASKTFYDNNADFFDNIPDPADGLRDWMDGVETRVGRGAAQKLHKTPAGQIILGQRHAAHAMRRALQYVFGKNRGRRWSEVEWTLIERLGESLAPYFEPYGDQPSQPGIYWMPYLGDLDIETAESLPPNDRARLTACEAQAEIRSALEALKTTYAKTRRCLRAKERRIVMRRIREWSRWSKDPRTIPAYACEPDEATGGVTCDYPAVAGELRQLQQACEHHYDPGWAAEHGRAGSPGYPRVNPDAPLRVRYSYDEGILICGDTRAHKDAIKQLRTRRFRFSRNLPDDCAWYVQRTRSRFVSRSVLEAIAAELGGLIGVDVDVDYEDADPDTLTTTSFAQREVHRAQRASRQADRKDDQAQSRKAESRKRFQESHDAIGWELGQPILVGHHSEGRHRRDLARVQRKTQQAFDAETESKRLTGVAARTRAASARRQDPNFAQRRLDELRKEQRGLEVKLTGQLPKGWRGLDPGGAATGDYAKQLTIRKAEITSEIEHWESVLEKSGAKQWAPDDFSAGDVVREPRSKAPLIVVRVNPKTLTVDAPAPFGDTWDLKLAYANVGSKLDRGGHAWQQAIATYAEWVSHRNPRPRGFDKRQRLLDQWTAPGAPTSKSPRTAKKLANKIAQELEAGDRAVLRLAAERHGVPTPFRQPLLQHGLIEGEQTKERLTALGMAVLRHLPAEPSAKPASSEPEGALRTLTRGDDELPDRKDVASSLRKLIRHHWPDLKLSITTPQYSMASAIDVRPRSGQRWSSAERDALRRLFGDTVAISGDSASIQPWDKVSDNGTALTADFVEDFKTLWKGGALRRHRKSRPRKSSKSQSPTRSAVKESSKTPEDVSKCGSLLNKWRRRTKPNPTPSRTQTMTAKKATSKKTASKKATSKKTASKKATAKKATAKKTAAKKTAPKTATKKTATKKTATKKTATRKTATKKTATKKTAVSRRATSNPNWTQHHFLAEERLRRADEILKNANSQVDPQWRVRYAMDAFAEAATAKADADGMRHHPGFELVPHQKTTIARLVERAKSTMKRAQRLAGVTKNPSKRRHPKKATKSSRPKTTSSTAAHRARRALSRI